MTRATFRSDLRALGWKENRKKGGGYVFREFPDRIITLIPQIWQTSTSPSACQIDLNPGLTTRRFSGYCHAILQSEDRGFHSFFRPRPPDAHICRRGQPRHRL